MGSQKSGAGNTSWEARTGAICEPPGAAGKDHVRDSHYVARCGHVSIAGGRAVEQFARLLPPLLEILVGDHEGTQPIAASGPRTSSGMATDRRAS